MKIYAVIMSILVVCCEFGVLSMAWHIGVTRGTSTLLSTGITGVIMLVFNVIFLSPIIVWRIVEHKVGKKHVLVDETSIVSDRGKEDEKEKQKDPDLGDYSLLVFFLCLFVEGTFACVYCLFQDLSEFSSAMFFIISVKIMLLIGTLVGLFLSGCSAYSLVTSLARNPRN